MIEKNHFIPVAKEYETVGSFNEDTKKVFAGEDTGMYQRYDYKELAADEKKFAEMIGVPDTALFNSGMAAIHTAIEAEGLKPGDVVLCSHDVYGVTKDYVMGLKKRGIKIQYFDPADIDGLKIAVNRLHPCLIIAETVANSKEMKMADPKAYAEVVKDTNEEYRDKLTPKKVLDNYLSVKESLKNLPETARQKILQAIAEFQVGNNPFVFRGVVKEVMATLGLSRKEAINEVYKTVKHVLSVSREKLSLILDNTLPSPILINPIELVGDITSEMTVVESGTKHYQSGKNKITMGIVYSRDPEKIKQIKNLRIQTGAYLQATSKAEIPSDITSLMPEILKRHAANALALARALETKGFTVYHPNLKSHKQNELAEKLAPNGVVTLFYIDLPEKIKDRDGFMDKVKKIGGDTIGLGSSFGHEKTWLSNFALEDRTIRIAVGMESPEEFTNVIRAFEQATDK